MVDKFNIIQEPLSKETIEEDERNLDEILDQQLELCKDDRIKEQLQVIDKIVEGKKKKLRKMGLPDEGKFSRYDWSWSVDRIE